MSAIHLPYIQTDIQPDTCHTFAAAGVPIGGFFRGAGIGNRERLSQVFSLVAGDGGDSKTWKLWGNHLGIEG